MQSSPRWTAKTLTTVIALTLLAVAPMALAGVPVGAKQTSGVTPLSTAERAILKAIVEDPAPKNLVRGNHYLISNEDRPHLFHNVLVDRGGALVGVGTDQLYVYAGWALSDLIIPMDFDKTVVDLHRIYMLLFTKASTPADFIQLWHKRNAEQVRAWLDGHEADPVLRERLGYAFRIGRQLVYARLKRMHSRYGRSKTPTFATDQAQYDHLVALVRGGRVHPVRGDLTQRGCLLAIGKALTSLGHEMDIIYLSNAEQYFEFDDLYRQNFFALPVDDASLVLRTSPLNRDGLYRYQSQRTVDFQAWLRRPKITRVKQIRLHRKLGWKTDTYVLPGPP